MSQARGPRHSHLYVEVPDENLLERAARGDAGAFDVFYRRHASAITTYFRRRVPSPELAFDLTAETFAAAVAGLRSFDATRGGARGWLFGIAANEWRQAWRRGQVEDRARRQLELEPIVFDDEALEVVERMTSDEALATAMAALSPAEAEAVRGHVVDERPYEQLAVEMRCSEAVVRQRVSRGLRRLRQALGVTTA